MKTRLIISLLFFIPVGLFAQLTLTNPNNSLRRCDANTYLEIQVTDPGNAGANQVWDFSGASYTGKDQGSQLSEPSGPKMTGFENYNVMLTENGYTYMLNASENSLSEMGYVNQDLKLQMTYSDPVLKMKYPFAYGDHFTDQFSGTALYGGTSNIEFTGTNTVAADAWGTLILPDRTIPGTLRVKTLKEGLQVNMCGTTDVSIARYSWYASGARYPVLTLNIVETRTNGGAPTVTRTAYANTTQEWIKSGSLLAGLPASPADQGISGISVVLSPNPFSDQLKFAYALPAAARVTIDISDLNGKSFGRLTQNELQEAGFHNGFLNSARFNLVPGVYLLRFTFDNQTATYKVVRM